VIRIERLAGEAGDRKFMAKDLEDIAAKAERRSGE